MAGSFHLPFDGPGGLFPAMKGKDTLSGWDVLVSYSNFQLNALLAERAKSLNIGSPDTWEALDEDPISDQIRTIVFDVKLLQPTMQLIDVSNQITVTFGMAGTYGVKGSQAKKSLPAGITIELATSLVNVSGQWHETGWQPNEGQNNPPGHNFVVIAEPGANAATGICIDLVHCKATLSETPGSNIPDGIKTHLQPLIATFIEKHFAKQGLRLCLAAISNHYDVNNKESQALQPTQFCFTIAGGILMTWIGLKGGPNTGIRPSGQTSVSFAPNMSAVSPIPAGRTASVIFSHSTIANLFMIPSLSQSPGIDGTKAVSCLSVVSESGMRFSFTLKSHPINIEKESVTYFGGGYSVDGCHFDMNEKPCSLGLSGENRGTSAQNVIALAWKGDPKTITASSYTSIGEGSEEHSSSCHITFDFGGSARWRGSTDPVKHPNQLGWTWQLNSTLGKTIVADQPDFWGIIGGQTGEVPSKYKDLQVSVTDLDLSLKPLDYFLTTNLLLPGQHVFIADDPVAPSVDVQSGLATPRDTILTGAVAASKGAQQARLNAVDEHRAFLGEPNGQALLATTVESTPLDRFRDAYLSFPSNTLLGDIFKYTMTRNPTQSAADLLREHGFDNMEDVNLLELWGTSIEELVGETAPVSQPEVSSVDLRTYANYYVVSKPDDDSGEQFLVHPLTGSIRMRNKDIVPQQSYDPEGQRVMVTWKLPTGEIYTASFSVVLHPQRLVLGTRCAGTVQHGDGSPPQPFEAFSRGYQPTPARLLADDPSDPGRKGESYLTMISLGINIVGSLGAFGYFLWNKKKTAKAMAAKDAGLADQQKKLDVLDKFVENTVAEKAAEKYRDHAAARDDALTNLERHVDEAARDTLRDIIARDPDALDRYGKDAKYREEVRREIGDASRERLKKEASGALNKITKLAIEAALAGNEYRDTLTTERRLELLEGVHRREVDRAVTNLQDSPNPGEPSFSELARDKAIEEQLAEAEGKQVENLDKVLKELEKNIGEQGAEIERYTREVVEKAKEAAERDKNSKPAQEAYERAQRQLEEMKREKARQEQKHGDTTNRREKSNGEKQRLESEKRESERKQGEKKRRAL